MITYHNSKLNPDCFYVAVDNVMVAAWIQNRWIDRGMYRPVRDHYSQVEWLQTPYTLDTMLDVAQFNRVKLTGLESYE